LRKGYYRQHVASLDVRKCPDAQTNCSGTFGSSECESSSGCQGGRGLPCADGLTGVYCRLCNNSDGSARVHYKAATAGEVAKCEACSNKVFSAFVVIAGVVAALGVALRIVRWIARRVPAKIIAGLKRTLASYSPRHKFKIVLSSTRSSRGFRASMT